MPHAQKDYKAAPAGTYAVDQSHSSVLAQVPHVGFSYEVVRFPTVTGTLQWDPANPAKDRLEVSVDPKSMTTAATGGDFAGRLTGPGLLNAAQFPKATFVSKSFHVVDAAHGTVDGDFTLMGVTKPMTFNVELVGAGQGFQGPAIGVHATATLAPLDFGLKPPVMAPSGRTGHRHRIPPPGVLIAERR